VGSQDRDCAVTKLGRFLVDVVSRALQPDEREVVLGDLQEAGEGFRAVQDVVGLVVRRQATLWTHWRPWLALVTVVAPLGVLLSHISAAWAGGTAIYSWLYVDNWTWGYLRSPGARHELALTVLGFGLDYVTLASWAWASGYTLGSLSRETSWLNAALLSLVTFVGTGSLTVQSANPFNAAAFSLTFYRAILPTSLRAVLVVIPAYWGACVGRRSTAVSGQRTTIGVVVMGILTLRTFPFLSGGYLVLSPRMFPIPADWHLKILGLTVAWPLTYMVAGAWRSRWGKPAAG